MNETRRQRALRRVRELREKSATMPSNGRIDWKPKAKIFLHPDTQIEERFRVWFPKEVKDGDDEKKTKVSVVPFTVSPDPKKNPFAAFLKQLKAREDIDGDDPVILVGKGREKVEILKGDALKWDGYDFRKRLTLAKDVVLVSMLVEDSKGAAPSEYKWDVLECAPSLGEDISTEIDSEMDEAGEEEGCPFITYYPFVIQYHSKKRGSDMYSARARANERPDEKLLPMFEEDCPSLDAALKLDDVDEIADLIKASIHPDLDFEFVFGDEERPRRRRKAKEPDPEPEPEPESEPESEPETESDEPEEPEAKASTRKKATTKAKSKAKSKPKEDPPESEPEGETEANEDPKPKTRRVRRKKEEPAEPKWEPAEGEDFDLCPSCGGKIPLNVTECPHCGEEFTPEDEEIPF